MNKKRYITINIPDDVHKDLTLLKIGFAYKDRQKYSMGETIRRVIDNARLYDKDAGTILGNNA